jgi:hypothetical protein
MGLFDSLKDALLPDDDPSGNDPDHPGADHPNGDADSTADSPKHLDESARPQFSADPSDLGTPTGGKHARRD